VFPSHFVPVVVAVTVVVIVAIADAVISCVNFVVHYLSLVMCLSCTSFVVMLSCLLMQEHRHQVHVVEQLSA
jgi:hypothetical protein